MAGKTVIGLIPLYDDERESIWMLPAYMDAISMAGGIPVILPMHVTAEDIDRIDDICDGYLFTGGHDISPALYGEKDRGKCGIINEDRDLLEKLVFDKAYKNDKPVLGICRGLQIINVLSGGTLYQDLHSETDTQIEHHMQPPYDTTAHRVEINKESSLYKLLKTGTLGVNSYHHQAVKKLAPCLKIMAKADDGTIEAIEDINKKFIWAVQWHPEYSYKKDENSRKILQAFVDACK